MHTSEKATAQMRATSCLSTFCLSSVKGAFAILGQLWLFEQQGHPAPDIKTLKSAATRFSNDPMHKVGCNCKPLVSPSRSKQMLSLLFLNHFLVVRHDVREKAAWPPWVCLYIALRCVAEGLAISHGCVCKKVGRCTIEAIFFFQETTTMIVCTSRAFVKTIKLASSGPRCHKLVVNLGFYMISMDHRTTCKRSPHGESNELQAA